MLCRDFGQQIDRTEFLSYLSDVTDGAFKAFIPIPGPNDWPETYSIKYQDLEKEKKLFLEGPPPEVADDFYIGEINYIFTTAADHKKDLVFISY